MSSCRDAIRMVPRRRAPGSVGRETEPAAVAAALSPGGCSALTKPAIIHGLGGVGKTLFAVEFASRHADDADGVFCLAAKDPAALASPFAEFAGTLGLTR